MENSLIYFVFFALICVTSGEYHAREPGPDFYVPEPVQGININCCPGGLEVAVAPTDVDQSLCFDRVNNMNFSLWNLDCNKTSRFRSYQKQMFINEKYQLVDNTTMSIINEPENFCIGSMMGKKELLPVVVLCKYEVKPRLLEEEIFAVLLIISSVFLFITAVIYMALPELRDTEGKSIVNFAISLGIGLLFLAVLKLHENYEDMTLCAIRGFLTYFFLIASFFWANVISIQILRSTRRPTAASYKWRDFLMYALYAWGGPILLTVTVAIVNYVPGYHQRPGIGLSHCWFVESRQRWIYLYSVMSVLILLNIGIFIYISIVLWKTNFNTTHIKAVRYRFHLTLRLFVVMGISWIFEMISTLFDQHVIWDLLDIFNLLQGVMLFFVLVIFRKRVIKAMYRHGWLDCISGKVERCLAVGDDEEDIAEHTVAMSMADTK